MKSWGGGALYAAMIGATLAAGCRLDYSNLFVSSGDFLSSGRTASFFHALQVDPRSEDSAGPQFAASGDLDNDGLPDLVSGWSESQPIQFHLQRRDPDGSLRFETTTLAGAIPIATMADLHVADFDQDGWADIAVLVKIRNLPDVSGDGPDPLDGAILIYFNPGEEGDIQDPLTWEAVLLGQSELAGVAEGDGTSPETGGYTDMEVGDVDADGDVDIVACLNWAIAQDDSPTATPDEESRGNGRIEVFFNPDANGASRARRGGEWNRFKSPTSNLVSLEATVSLVRDVALADVDGDNDLDVVVTRPDADTMNVRWLRNPVIRRDGDPEEWQSGAIGHVFTGADAVETGDLDGDGRLDVLVQSRAGRVVQWFRGPQTPLVSAIRNVPWQVYTLAEFTERTPETMAVADFNGDGQLEVLLAAQGGIAWFDAQAAESVYDQWVEVLIIDDRPGEGNPDTPTPTDPNVSPEEVAGTTSIRALNVVDLDQDGQLDFIATLDRAGLSGLTNDALVWFENTR
ncbi:MAG: VCBS repeat-containing protein [Phycisphaerales bacterium]|nr:MAG: VCBS repeat-containing protein [Phycisphaerales bacterium]